MISAFSHPTSEESGPFTGSGSSPCVQKNPSIQFTKGLCHRRNFQPRESGLDAKKRERERERDTPTARATINSTNYGKSWKKSSARQRYVSPGKGHSQM